MTTSTQWQLARESAERYQTILTPTILGPFAQALVDFAQVQQGERVVDVGCGTGAAARYAAEVVGSAGHVVGIDVNASMIDVARSLSAEAGVPVEWREADAADLPLADSSVDVALCAQTLQFLAKKQQSLSEMERVIKTSGRLALSLWCPLVDNPYFAALVAAVSEHVSPATAVGLRAAFALSEAADIERLLQSAALRPTRREVGQLDLPLPPLAEFVPRHISATPMAAGFRAASRPEQQRVVGEVITSLSQYEANGRWRIPFRSHMILIDRLV